MRILALETSGTSGSVAGLADGVPLGSVAMCSGQRSAQAIQPAIKELLTTLGWRPSDVDLVAVTAGPGSFTGLRVGVTVAKTFALATGAQILGVDTLDCLAQQAPHGSRSICAVIDAYRAQLFARWYVRHGESSTLAPTSTSQIIDIDGVLASLQPGTLVIGPVLEKLNERLPPGVVVADRAVWEPSATTVGQLAWSEFEAGRRDDVVGLLPVYLRRSAAEEQADSSSSGA